MTDVSYCIAIYGCKILGKY